MSKKPRNLKFSAFSKENLGKLLFDARERRNLNRSEFAKRLRVPRTSLIAWETGLRVPDADAIAGICAQLGLDANQLLGLHKVYEGDDVGRRISRLIDAEGAEGLVSSIGLTKQAFNRMLQAGYFGVTTKGVRAIALAYNLSVEWLLTGSPKHWHRSLQEKDGERLRYFRICHGISSANAKGTHVLWDEFQKGVIAKGKEVASLDGLLLALQAIHGRSPDFPFELSWIVTGKVELEAEEKKAKETAAGSTQSDNERK